MLSCKLSGAGAANSLPSGALAPPTGPTLSVHNHSREGSFLHLHLPVISGLPLQAGQAGQLHWKIGIVICCSKSHQKGAERDLQNDFSNHPALQMRDQSLESDQFHPWPLCLRGPDLLSPQMVQEQVCKAQIPEPSGQGQVLLLPRYVHAVIP